MHSVDTRQAEGLRRLSELMRRVNSSVDLTEMLDEVAWGVVEVLGYGVAAIDVRRGDQMVMTAVAGPDEVREMVLGRKSPVSRLLQEMNSYAEEWGILRYLPHENTPILDDELSWIPDIEVSEEPDAWHPLDALYAPLYDASGELIGNVSVDLPPNNKLPSLEDRELLEMFVVQAGLAMSHAARRQKLDKQVRLAGLIREIGEGGILGNLEVTLRHAARLLRHGLRPQQLWIRCFPDADFDRPEESIAYPNPTRGADAELIALKRALALHSLETGASVEVNRDTLTTLPLDLEAKMLALDYLETYGASTMLATPVAVGRELLGYVVLLRASDQETWDEDDREAAMEIGRTLGRATLDSRLFARERQLVKELQDVDRYRSELIATISHELKTPLTSIMGHVELLEDLDTGIDSVPAISRNAQRLNRLVENLLAYSRAQESQDTVRQTVDLVELAENSLDLLAMAAQQGGVHLEGLLSRGPILVSGDPDELSKVIDNLISNAVKYTPRGGHVCVTVGTPQDGYAEVCCTDDGLGISASDLNHLFSAFNRSSNPDALSIPGTGLGLAISRRIARMHGGEILVTSTLGEGSTFKLRLPLRTSVVG